MRPIYFAAVGAGRVYAADYAIYGYVEERPLKGRVSDLK